MTNAGRPLPTADCPLPTAHCSVHAQDLMASEGRPDGHEKLAALESLHTAEPRGKVEVEAIIDANGAERSFYTQPQTQRMAEIRKPDVAQVTEHVSGIKKTRKVDEPQQGNFDFEIPD